MPTDLQSARILVDANPTNMTPMPIAGDIAFQLPQPLPAPPNLAELRLRHKIPGNLTVCTKVTLNIVADNP